MLAAASPDARAQDYFGAIAYSLESGAHGWANNHPTREAAERAAMANCLRFAQDCKVALWFGNACAALATSPRHGYGTGWGDTQMKADNEAMKACATHSTGCFVKRRLCTEGKQ